MANSIFFQKIIIVTENIALYINKRVKGLKMILKNDSKVLEKLNSIAKFFRKFRKSRPDIDKELNKKAKYDGSKLITSKK